MRITKLSSLLLLTPALACSGSSNSDDDTVIIPPSELTCPTPTDGTLSVCDLKLDGGAGQPQFGDAVVVTNVVVTTPTYSILEDSMTNETTLGGFFVQDGQSTEELAGRYGGILVTYRPDMIAGTLPSEGDVVQVTGSFRDFGQEGGARQKQIEATAVDIISAGSGAVQAVPVDDATSIIAGGARAEGLEGSLVKISNVAATVVRDVPGSGGSAIFGAFQVTGGLVISGEIFQYRAIEQESFITITGVLRVGTAPFDSGIYQLTPRSRADVVSSNPTQTITSIPELQDPSTPDRPQLCSRSGATTVGRCPPVRLSDVVVTASGGYVSSNLRSIWVQDTTVADGRFAGVKVVYFADDTGIPQVGDIIDIEGEAIEWFRGTQVQNATFTQKGTVTSSTAPIVVAAADVARTSAPETNPYEGVLVEIQNVAVTERCVDSNGRDFGNWVVDGPVFLGTAFEYTYNGGFGPSTAMCDMPNVDCSCAGMSRPDDLRMSGDNFRALRGVMNYSFDEFRMEPRGDGDIVQ
ncbi:MAG: hypothetical protein RIT81_04725 [Deltaproteobacteria bacterium]